MLLSDKTITELCTGTFVSHLTIPTSDTTLDSDLTRVPVERIINTIDAMGQPMIAPFVGHSVKENGKGQRIPSYGLSSYGYDVRLAPSFKIFNKPNDGRVIDIMNFNEEDHCEVVEADMVIIPPGGLVLGHTLETFNIPRNITGNCLGKSTWARIGCHPLTTPLEAGWKGQLVIELANLTNQPMKVYAGVGIAQLQFFLGDKDCTQSYADRGGKYQDQTGVTGSRL